jgi:hypothetical protein
VSCQSWVGAATGHYRRRVTTSRPLCNARVTADAASQSTITPSANTGDTKVPGDLASRICSVLSVALRSRCALGRGPLLEVVLDLLALGKIYRVFTDVRREIGNALEITTH